ncbi:MAG: PaeR7I family type II restriction endonuclease [Phycisphaerae bacterium]|nr:PaeR7I family type II restriction endonuclease [Phycisphaerae bacterium]
MRDLDRQLRAAIRHFWHTRQHQATRQGSFNERDRGGRSAVTGGKQMDGFLKLVQRELIKAGTPEACILTNKLVELPGWFRAEKKWDLVVVRSGELLAAVEFKSQIGPSFGNNFNNRTEEAIGSATDIWAAYREGAFKPSARPFLGYMMLLEDCERSRTSVSVAEPHFNVFPEFQGASYRDRYAILIEKLLRERLYDGACFLTSSPDRGPAGDFVEPNPELTFRKFLGGLVATVSGREA